ncbi:secretin N-terminal domain-containing protein [Paucibacter sp. APW11]|uniref:Secretin N-terminal domain-containing protein n=1 Tax=Roseateles aquae TaxID=3077235 RepID=A0ABU3P877_9BURK|nr:secretin N-terminal domain-containing protein [Paucibacter sp. APW11]MDT8998757.1 secretin N-terminal domain-containing protein [Paucibacter sp. APW11]
MTHSLHRLGRGAAAGPHALARRCRSAALPLMPIALALAFVLSGCAEAPLRLAQPADNLRAELEAHRQQQAARLAQERSLQQAQPASPQAATPAAPPPAAPAEPRFDLIVNGAQIRDVFLSLVTDTRYSMLVHPDVSGQLSVTLKGVTLREALESIRDVYGFDFRIDGRRISVYPPTMQTRVFSVNYLQGQRLGRSELRVSSGAALVAANSGGTGSGSTGTSTAANGAGNNTGNGSNGALTQPESSQVSTLTRSDFWADTAQALRNLVGSEPGRSVIVSPQAGTIAVRAMPQELRHVEAFLRATRLAVERQVMLEAKIVEVELREGFQSGVDWSVLGKNGSIGQTSVNPSIPSGVNTVLNPLVSNSLQLPVLSTGTQAPAWPDLIPLPSAGGGAFGLALSKGGFQGLLSFLQSHGDLQILSSPRVATLNNQKAVLKVGTDDYFVTGITGGNTNTGTSTNNNVGISMPTLTLTPFFSGIALDVTPQIDDAGMVTLHIHPSVTTVTEKIKQVDLGTIGNYRLPLASSSVNETDTVVRIPDGAIAAIGGLMQLESSRRGSGLPGAEQNPITATLFGNRANSGRKRELVVLIKPTIIHGSDDWDQLNPQLGAADTGSDSSPRRVITVNPPPSPPSTPSSTPSTR